MSTTKKVFVSDLHLGDGSKSDDFHRDDELADLVSKYWNDETYLLGDIYELWQAKLSKIMWKHEGIIKILKAADSTFIYGNHDYLPFSKYWTEVYEDELIYAEHGHQYDIYNNTSMFNLKWPIGKYATIAVGWLERLLHKDVDEFLLKKYGEFKYMAAKLQGAKKSGHKISRASKAYVHVSPTRQPIYVTGHTHKAELYKFNDCIYANCGAWVDDTEPTYIEVEQVLVGEASETVVRLRHGITYEIIKEESILS